MNYSVSGFWHDLHTPPSAIWPLGQALQCRRFSDGMKPLGQLLHESSNSSISSGWHFVHAFFTPFGIIPSGHSSHLPLVLTISFSWLGQALHSVRSGLYNDIVNLRWLVFLTIWGEKIKNNNNLFRLFQGASKSKKLKLIGSSYVTSGKKLDNISFECFHYW